MVLRPDSVSVVIPTIHANPILLAACKQAIEGLNVVIVDELASFGENCNLGAEYASGEVLIFLNDDTEPQEGWLAPILRALEDPKIGIVGSRLVYPDGRIQHAGVYLDCPHGVLTAHNERTEKPSRFVDAVTGACLAIRKATFRELGGFDTTFRNGYEDIDLCLRARAARWRIWYCADSTVIHHESQSGPARWTHVRENIARLQEKWG